MSCAVSFVRHGYGLLKFSSGNTVNLYSQREILWEIERFSSLGSSSHFLP